MSRPLLAVHLDVDVEAIHDRRRLLVLEGFVRHDVAPVAGPNSRSTAGSACRSAARALARPDPRDANARDCPRAAADRDWILRRVGSWARHYSNLNDSCWRRSGAAFRISGKPPGNPAVYLSGHRSHRVYAQRALVRPDVPRGIRARLAGRALPARNSPAARSSWRAPKISSSTLRSAFSSAGGSGRCCSTICRG